MGEEVPDSILGVARVRENFRGEAVALWPARRLAPSTAMSTGTPRGLVAGVGRGEHAGGDLGDQDLVREDVRGREAPLTARRAEGAPVVIAGARETRAPLTAPDAQRVAPPATPEAGRYVST